MYRYKILLKYYKYLNDFTQLLYFIIVYIQKIEKNQINSLIIGKNMVSIFGANHAVYRYNIAIELHKIVFQIYIYIYSCVSSIG